MNINFYNFSQGMESQFPAIFSYKSYPIQILLKIEQHNYYQLFHNMLHLLLNYLPSCIMPASLLFAAIHLHVNSLLHVTYVNCTIIIILLLWLPLLYPSTFLSWCVTVILHSLSIISYIPP